MDDSLTGVLAEFVVGTKMTDISPAALARARDAITDGVGVGVAGARSLAVELALGSLDEEGQHPVIGRSETRSRGQATLLWGLAIHALDFDDTAHPGYCHPTAVLLPTLTAIDGLEGGLAGERVLASYVVGIEVINTLGSLLNLKHYQAGWHATSTLGTFGATAAAAFAIGTDMPTTASALSIAASMVGGVRANFGSMAKPLHAGLAARSALESILLASHGFTSTKDAIGGPSGFLEASGGPVPRRTDMEARLGHPWEIESEVGLALKPYPSCGATHPGIEAATLLREKLDGTPESVRVGVNGLTPGVVTYDRPTNGLEAKFSMHYCIAAALDHGELHLADFEDEAVRTFVEGGKLDVIDVEVDERVRDDGEFATIVSVNTVAGSTFEEFVPLARGKPARWPTEELQHQKFVECLKASDNVDGAVLWQALRQLGHQGDLGEVLVASVARTPDVG